MFQNVFKRCINMTIINTSHYLFVMIITCMHMISYFIFFKHTHTQIMPYLANVDQHWVNKACTGSTLGQWSMLSGYDNLLSSQQCYIRTEYSVYVLHSTTTAPSPLDQGAHYVFLIYSLLSADDTCILTVTTSAFSGWAKSWHRYTPPSASVTASRLR